MSSRAERCQSRREKRKFDDTARTMDKDIKIPENINSVLPPEMLGRVFSHLAPKDLKTAMLVCKSWKNAAGRPAFWSWVKLRCRSQLSLKRLQGAREIAINDPPKGSWHKLCQAILQHPGLKKIILDSSHFKPEELKQADLLSQVFAKMEDIEIRGWYAARCVVDCVLKGQNNLKRLVLNRTYGEDPYGEDPVLLATALNKIEVLDVELTEEQANLLFKTMKDETSIKSLYLRNDLALSKLEPTHFFGAFDKLDVLNLDDEYGDNVPFQLDVITTFCETVAAGTNLKRLSLYDVHLSQVNHHLLGRMAMQMAKQLEELQLLRRNRRMRDQIGTIVEAIANTEVGTLKTLSLHGIDLGLVEGCLLARMATQVEELKLYSNFDQDQAKAIFEVIAAGPGRLKKLEITRRLDDVDADILACAVNNLEVFYQNDSAEGSLPIGHMKKILSKALKETSLKTLIFQGERRHMKSRLIKEAKKIIPYISIRPASLSDTETDSMVDSDSGHEIESESDFESDSDVMWSTLDALTGFAGQY